MGHLILAATPIGNLGDAPPRLAEVIATADVVMAEDTRRSSILLSALGVQAELRSYFAGNEQERARELEERLARGETVVLITDAGTPGISDPGLTAVEAARTSGATVSVIPGPSAVTASLAVSGMPADRFVFEGFLPRRGRERTRRLRQLATEERTIVLFVSPHRLGKDLGDLIDELGADRPLCVCREITKQHEEVWWGALGDAASVWSEREPRGEFTLVLAGAQPSPPDLTTGVAEARKLIEEGSSPSDAAREAAARTGVSRREIYEALTR